MCGIGGVLFHDDNDQSPRRGWTPAWAHTLVQSLAHRGPDGHGTYVDDGVLLAHTRLAMTDVAHGQQPMTTPDGRYAIVVNGEIYNHHRLRPQLQSEGAMFRSHSDAEVLLWSWALRGCAALDDMEGEFAFCIWDHHQRRAWLGRDTLGVKPLVLAVHNHAVWFASEAKVLLSIVGPKQLDSEAVVTSLVMPAWCGERVPWQGIEPLPPGHVLEVRAGRRRIVRVQQHHPHQPHQPSTPSPMELADALEAAVRDRCAADVPMGTFLSGGLDSSAIMAIAHREQPKMPAFTIRFDRHHHHHTAGGIVVDDDARYTEELAATWALPLVRVHATQTALLADIHALVASQDRLVAWEQELSQRALAKTASTRVKGVLVGDAADETHFGYSFLLHPSVCRSARSLVSRFGFDRRRLLLSKQWHPSADAAVEALHDSVSFGESLTSQRVATTACVQQRWLPRLLHNGDLHTMAFGLEARVPFADGRVLQQAAQVSVVDAYRDDQPVPEKAVLRQAVSSWLPTAIASRPKSALPRDEDIGPQLRIRLRAELLQPQRLDSWFDIDALHVLANSDEAIGDEERSLLFTVVCFAAWLRHHLL